MTNKEYIRRFRAAVAEFMTDPEGYMGHAGLCYGLSEASEVTGELYFYTFIAKFVGSHERIGERGVFNITRLTVVLLLANLDDDTIIFIKNSEWSE